MKCCLLSLLFWCTTYRHTHIIAASFSLFEDNGNGNKEGFTAPNNGSYRIPDENGIRQAVPPGEETVEQAPSHGSQNENAADIIPVAAYNHEEEGSQKEDDDLMYYLTQYRSRPRRTVEGHLCASAFLERNQIYTDCTKEVAPDGTQDREWCYHESQLNGKLERDWGFCEPPLNYEKIRAALIVKIREKVEQAQELKEALVKHRSLLGNMEKRLETFCGYAHKNVARSLTRLEELMHEAEEDLKEMRSLSNEIAELKKELKREQCRYETNRSQMPAEVVGSLSDGLLGTYFSGHLFDFPAYGSRIDREINFVFSDFMPIVGLNPHCFSVIWKGFIKAPHSGNFVFTIETTSFARMELEGVEIINNGIIRQGVPEEGYRYSVDPLMRGATLTSPSQQLIGGKFYRIQIEFSHSQQYHYIDKSSILKLEFSSLRLQREVIKDYLYSKVVPSNLAISYLSHEHFSVSRAQNGSLADRENSGSFLANLSNNLVGTHLITTLRSPTFRSFVMQVNVGCILYVGYTNDVFPISAITSDALKFKDASSSSGDLADKDGKVTPLKIKETTLIKGHTYKFNIEVTGVPFVLFLSEKVMTEISRATGPITVVSVPDSDFYLGCEESSKIGDGFGCEAGFSGKLLDQKGAIWRANEGAGAWLKIIFKRPVLLSGFQLKQSDDPSRWVRRLSMELTDRSEFFEILHSNDPKLNHYYLSEPVAVTSVTIKVEDLYLSSDSTSIGVNLLGQKIEEESWELAKVFMNCTETLEDNIDLQPLTENHSYELICNRKCFPQSSGTEAHEIMDIKTPPCSVLNMDVCSYGGNPHLCHAGLIIVKNREREGELGYVISKLDKQMRIVPFAVSILFKTAANRLPQQSFLVDNGSMKAPIDPAYLQQTGGNQRMGEVSYGWLRPNVNEGSEVGIAFPAAGESEKCIQKTDCQPNYWSIDVPRNGRYKVELVIGDTTDAEQWLSIELNGVALLKCVKVPQGSLYTVVKEIDVSNNALKLTSTSSDPACVNKRTTLQFFKVREL